MSSRPHEKSREGCYLLVKKGSTTSGTTVLLYYCTTVLLYYCTYKTQNEERRSVSKCSGGKTCVLRAIGIYNPYEGLSTRRIMAETVADSSRKRGALSRRWKVAGTLSISVVGTGGIRFINLLSNRFRCH